MRYEIGICIRTGEIVWAHGGLPAGEWPDLKLARNAILDAVGPREMIIADGGYNDRQYFETLSNPQKEKAILARHETVNRRVKQFSCMSQTFRHSLYLHPRFFHAVINLTQLMIENGEPLYPVEY